MTIETTFNAMELGTEFVYLGRRYKKITKPNGKVGAIDLITQVIYPDCKHWTSCIVSIPDKKDTPNRTNFSIIGDSGELYNIISLTPSQIRLLKWLDDNGYISEDINIEKTSSFKVIEI